MLFDRSAPVLLVEPRASATRIISDLLLRLGFETIEAVDGSTTALDILHKKGPRLVIADLHIEPMNALQVLRTVRSDDRLKRTPFIIAAESLSPVEALAFKHAGVDSFLLKPFRAEALERKVEAALLARPSAQALVEATTHKSSSAALGRRFERYRA
jgi:two-component system chemotaxis response regulator CheY